MRGLRSGGALGAAVLALVGLGGPAGIPGADASWNVGGGTLRGSVTYGPADVGCPTGSMTLDTVDGAGVTRITGHALNTVMSGHVGDIRLTGSGCNGVLHLSAGGTGPTGSQFDCADLEGSYATTPEARWTFSGECVVNDWNMGTVTFSAALTVVPTGAGATLAGAVAVHTDTSRTLLRL